MLETAEEGYEISDYDIISLYPSCNFEGPYPVGHPEILHPEEMKVNWQSQDDIRINGERVEGLIKVRIIPPRSLYLPVIPIRIPGDKRLLFALCHKCAKKFSSKNTMAYDTHKCEHTDEERVKCMRQVEYYNERI